MADFSHADSPKICRLGCRLRWAQGSTSAIVFARLCVPSWEGTLAPLGEYDWTVHLRRQCGLLSNYFDHLYIVLHVYVWLSTCWKLETTATAGSHKRKLRNPPNAPQTKLKGRCKQPTDHSYLVIFSLKHACAFVVALDYRCTSMLFIFKPVDFFWSFFFKNPQGLFGMYCWHILQGRIPHPRN